MWFQNPPDPELVKKAKRELFESGEFDANWSESFFRILAEKLADLGERFNGLMETSPALGWLLLGGLTVILLALLGHMLHTVFKEVGRLQALKTTGSTRGEAAVVALEGRAKSFEEAAALVLQAIDAGNPRTAVWILHRLLLGILDGKGALVFAAWKTNGDYLLECRRDHPNYPLLVRLTQIYESVIYAHESFAAQPLRALLEETRAARSSV